MRSAFGRQSHAVVVAVLVFLVRALYPLHGSGRGVHCRTVPGARIHAGGWQATLTMPSAGSGRGKLLFARVNSAQWKSIGVPTSLIGLVGVRYVPPKTRMSRNLIELSPGRDALAVLDLLGPLGPGRARMKCSCKRPATST